MHWNASRFALALSLLLAGCVAPPAGLTPIVGDGSVLPTPVITPPSSSAPATTDGRQGWERMGLNAITFEYPSGSVITSTTYPPPPASPERSVNIAGQGSFFQVTTSIGEAPLFTDDSFPANVPTNEGLWRLHFPDQIEVEGATKAMVYLIGIWDKENSQWAAPLDSEQQPFVTLVAELYDAGCPRLIGISTGFVLSDTEQVQNTSLGEVVAQKYPYFDHMIHSVRFPSECPEAP